MVGAILHIFGAVNFVHRLDSSLNRHPHDHGCILDGVFERLDDGPARPHQAGPLTSQEIAAIAEQARLRVRGWFADDGLLNPDNIRDMPAWGIGGFSLHTSVRIAGHDRARLERLLRSADVPGAPCPEEKGPHP